MSSIRTLVKQYHSLRARAVRLEMEAFCDPSRQRQLNRLRAARNAWQQAEQIEKQLRRLGHSVTPK